MIETKVQNLVNDINNLRTLSALKLPVKTSYWISRILARVESEMDIYDKKRDELIKRYGEKNEKDGSYKVIPANLDTYYDELKKIGEIPFSVGINKINVSQLGEIQIEPSLLISWIFTSDDDSGAKESPVTQDDNVDKE